MIINTITNKKILTNGKELLYNEVGEGQPIVLLHGLFGNLSNWSETITYFSKTYRVITPVLPIYDAPWKKDVLTELVNYVHGIISELKLEKIILVGNSLGGHVATLYTLAYPTLVDRLILTGSSGLFESNLGVSYPKKGNYNYIAEKVRYTFYDQENVSKDLIDEVFNTVNDIKKSLGVLRAAKAANRNNVSNELGKITTPTLLIWGRQDRVTPIDVAWQFREKIGGEVQLHIIDQCGHAPMMEHPEKFNTILNIYLNGDTSVSWKNTSEELQVA